MTDIAPTLRDAIQQTLNGALSGPALLRRFMAHDEWRVPIHLDGDGKAQFVYVRDTGGQRFQFLFTDEQTYQNGLASVGQGLVNERYRVTNGRALFVDLSEETDVISINWGSPPEIFFKQAQIASLRRWARAVAVEQTLATPQPDLQLLKQFDSFYIVLQKIEEGHALTLAPDQRGRKLAAVFTAEDTVEAFLNDQGAGEFNFEPVTRTIPGAHLFDDLKDMPLDGIVFNCSGPVAARTFSAALATAVMAAA